MSLTTGGHHPTNSHKLRFQGTNSPAASAGLPAGGPPGLGRIASLIAKPDIHESFEKFFLNTSKEGPVAIVPLESSVLVGRSERAYRRDGWLELQERLTEEMAAAVVWLFGVGYLQNKFEKVSNKLNKGKSSHLSTNIAWNKPWEKVNHVDLTPQQMFARNHKEINTLLQLKSARWLFSVGTALALVGYFIPKGNQLKTNMILRHLERRKRGSEGSNVQFGDPNSQNQPNGAQQRMAGPTTTSTVSPSSRSLMPRFPVTMSSLLPSSHFPVPGIFPNSMSGSAKGTSTFNQANAIATPFNHPISTQFLGQVNQNLGSTNGSPNAHGHSGVRFGAGFPGLAAIQAIGASVEQTNYGQLLAVDFGIAGGRGYVASKRSPYETAEVLFRDIVSLYFYILCAPHLMSAITSGMDKAFNSSSHLQPKVAELVHDQIEKGLDKGHGLARIIYGLSDAQMAPEGPLKTAIRSIDHNKLRELINKEAKVYLGSQALLDKINPAIQPYLKPSKLSESTKAAATLNPSYIQHLLNAVDSGNGAFKKLSTAERQNLGIAIKQATRHTAGIEIDFNKLDSKEALPPEANENLFKELFDQLKTSEYPEVRDEVTLLKNRIRHMATLEGMDQTHSMLRRSANVLREKLSTGEESAKQLLERGDALANWLDTAKHHAETIEGYMARNLEEISQKLHEMKLEGRPLLLVQDALGKEPLNTLGSFKTAMSAANAGQLRQLAVNFELIQNDAITKKGSWPFNSKGRKFKAMNQSLADLSRRLEGCKDGNATPAQALKDSIVDFMNSMKGHSAANADERDLLEHYSQEIHKIVQDGKGRFFSLAIRHEDKTLSQKLRETLRGGIISDSKLVSQALETVGQLETDTRKMPSTPKEVKMRKAIASYTEALYKRFNPANLGNMSEEAQQNALKAELKAYRALNRNLHYAARTVSLGTAMVCIGWLVPILQTKITKHLTGKDNNPGIASAKKLMDEADAAEAKKARGLAPTASITGSAATTAFASAARPMTNAAAMPFKPQAFNPPIQPVVS